MKSSESESQENSVRITYVGGPTALIEIGGLRILTDPTLDPGGGEYPTAAYTLHKSQGPAVGLEELGAIDAVLLSHDHHFDNLDRSGRLLLGRVPRVLTTEAGAERLGDKAEGLAPWASTELESAEGRTVRVTATPARHGPPDGDRGPVIGFALSFPEREGSAVYFSGDTVWYEGVAEVASRFRVWLALLNLGAARVAAAGPRHLTFTGEEGVEAARAFAEAAIVPLHFEGWEHFSEGRTDIERAFAAAGLDHRLHWLPPGAPVEFPPP
jgi:L-ascorbate metabolism protein UlaG (beta-lactamase superfamily)